MCLVMAATMLLAGCEKNQAVREKDSRQESSRSAVPAVSGNNQDRMGKDLGKAQGGKEPVREGKVVEKHIPLDGSLGEILQISQHKGEDRMLTLDQKNRLHLRNVSEGREYRYQFDFGKGDSINSYEVLSWGNDIAVHVNIHKSRTESQDSSQTGMVRSSTDISEEDRVYVFDQKLHLKKKDTLPESLTAIVLDGGEGFIALEDEGIFRYSLRKGKGKRLGGKIQKKLKDITVWSMYVNQKQNRIAFLGQVIGQDKKDVYGWIDLENQSVEVKNTENSYGNHLHMQGDTAYVTDGEIPRKMKATGVVRCMDLSAGAFFDLQVDNLESTNASLAEDGSTLFACGDVLSKDRDRVVGYTLRIYDILSGKVLHENAWKKGGEVFRIFSAGRGFYAVKEKELHYMELQ